MDDRSGQQHASEGQRRAVVGGYVPRQNLSASGKQLTGVYEDGGAQAHPFARQSRTINFRNGIYAAKPARPRPIAYGSSYIPQHRGYTGVVRALPVREVMHREDKKTYEPFKKQGFVEGVPGSAKVTTQEMSTARKSYKDMGRRAYKTEFVKNRETMKNAPIRARKPKM